MDKLIGATLFIMASMIMITNPQKVPPGVNPNAYQQPPQTQQYQPPPPQQVQYQQPIQSALPPEVPIQQHPVPIQQHPPPPPPQQQQQHAHTHHDHNGQPQLLNAANLAEEKEHMQEHLNVNIDTSKMTEQELQFHYFKMHDADNNNKLDGCELIKSLIHWHDDDDHAKEVPVKTDEELGESVDHFLEAMDKDHDGYVDWFEYSAEHHEEPSH